MIFFAVVLQVAILCPAIPTTNTYASVTNDWYNAYYTNVYELAQQRLSGNTNDLVAAYLMLEWQTAFGSVASVSNALTRVIDLSDSVTNQPFRTTHLALREANLEYRDVVLPTINDAEVEAERYKAFLPHKKMTYDLMLRLLWTSGLW